MNVLPILDKAIKRTALDYEAGCIDRAGIETRMRRIFALKRKARTIERFKEVGRARVMTSLDALERTRKVVSEGGTVVAIDVGFRDPGFAEEVGVTTWSAGRLETVTYVDETRVAQRSDFPSLYGPTRALPYSELMAVGRQAFSDADIVVFHDQHCDLQKLELEPDARIVDTMRIGRIWFRRKPSLADLCQRYGLPIEHAHNSGNDSRRTLEALFHLADDELPVMPMRVPSPPRAVIVDRLGALQLAR